MPTQPALTNPVFAEPVFGEASELPNPLGFVTPHRSDTATYDAVEKLLKTQVVAIPPSRAGVGDLYNLEQAMGARGSQAVSGIKSSGRIVFHVLGDSGATQQRIYKDEINLTDQMTVDAHGSQAGNTIAFCMHLGDVVYSFGESEYYFDQFYEPFRNYPAPIFAIPGNHDSFVIPNTAIGQTALDTFQRNFCAPSPVITAEARSLHRTAMTQPGVYYALEAPFVRILALFSNALEDPGLISGENGRWPGVSDVQLDFLNAQFEKAADEKYAGALLIAVHHPPFSYGSPPRAGHNSGGAHGSSTAMLRQIDTIAQKTGIYPHAFLSGHAHNYQHYTRTLRGIRGNEEFEVPFIVCGDGGHHINTLVQQRRADPTPEPQFGTDVTYLDIKPAVNATRLVLEKYNDTDYGYLRVSADAKQLRIAYHIGTTGSLLQSRFDLTTVNLKTHRLDVNRETHDTGGGGRSPARGRATTAGTTKTRSRSSGGSRATRAGSSGTRGHRR